MLTAQEIRRRYLDFFRRRQHEIVPSGPLIPPDDPSLLFTNAGMVQFKKMFLGEERRPYRRASTCQKCLRVSGKHNDLENVGRTARHHTFFEMLGNFSFGDYFKREAITFAWEFVTGELGLPEDRLWVTVFRDDDEAASIWREVAGLPEERIVRMGEKDNFWTMGDVGPCGPCSEIYIDQGEDMSCGPECGIGRCDCDRFLEIWNLVFTQYDQGGDGSRSLLAAPNIDTGMGLERMAAVCQGRRSNFDCDLFQEIIQYAAGVAGVSYSFSAPDTNDVDTALRVIADHSRAAAFLIAEGVLPSNENRGYVLRRLIRRALRFATLMGVHEPFMHKVARKVTEVMGDAYPELPGHADFIERAVLEEERRFSQTLEKGLAILDEELERLGRCGESVVAGEFCFRLYDTYGFPLDIVTDVAEKRGFSVDAESFGRHMASQRERARNDRKKASAGGAGVGEALKKLARDGHSSEFTGYARLEERSPIAVLLDGAGAPVKYLGEGGSGYAIFPKTPFYGESGGQTGDPGRILAPGGEAAVREAIRVSPTLVAHGIEVLRGELHVGDEATLLVDADARLATARNHTCTHLLHAALRRVLGAHVRQAGSLVDATRLRFDFSHFSALTDEELAAVERDVNRAILADFPVSSKEMDREEAISSGAMALFSEKYADRVRVVRVDGDGPEPESMELCGGTHLSRTGQAGSFYIVSESAVAAGVRRIEAVTGWNAYAQAAGWRAEVRTVGRLIKAAPGKLAERAKSMSEEIRKLRKASEKGQGAGDVAALVAAAEKINGITFVSASLADVPVKALRAMMDDVRSRLAGPAAAVLASVENGRVTLLVHVSRELQPHVGAPDLVREAAPAVGGSGGGRPDMAQAGGNRPDGLPRALELVRDRLAALDK